jgi:hypothetical protein
VNLVWGVGAGLVVAAAASRVRTIFETRRTCEAVAYPLRRLVVDPLSRKRVREGSGWQSDLDAVRPDRATSCDHGAALTSFASSASRIGSIGTKHMSCSKPTTMFATPTAFTVPLAAGSV